MKNEINNEPSCGEEKEIISGEDYTIFVWRIDGECTLCIARIFSIWRGGSKPLFMDEIIYNA